MSLYFHTILIRRLPIGTEKTQIYFLDSDNIVHRSSWQSNRNIECQLDGIFKNNLIVGIDYYCNGSINHIKKQITNLIYIGPKLIQPSTASIQIIFQTHKGYYIEDTMLIHNSHYSSISNTLNNSSLSMKSTSKTNPATCAKIKELQAQIASIQLQLESLSINDTTAAQRVLKMRELTHQQLSKNHLLDRKNKQRLNSLNLRTRVLNQLKDQLASDKLNLLEAKEHYSINKQHLLKLLSNKQLLQSIIIKNLIVVYDIHMTNGKCYINSIYLPNSIFNDVDHKQISIALGHCAHLIHLFSQYLFIDLDYPIYPRNSSSLILDKSHLSFSLFHTPNTKLDWAVYLLNKNIQQLLYHHGQPAHDLRKTLVNLKLLMELIN